MTGAEILQAKKEFFGHGSGAQVRYVLCDFSAAEKLLVSSPEVDKIIRQDRDAVASHPVLAEVVVAPRPFEFGLARMWELQIEHERPRTAVVKSRKEALAWLGKQGVTLEDG